MANDKSKIEDTDEATTFDIEPILNYIGPKGKWQYVHSICLFLFGISGGMSVVSFGFPGYVPRYRCVVPICENMENVTYDSDYKIINSVVTKDRSCSKLSPNVPYESCEEFLNMLQNDTIENIIETCDKDQLVFDKSVVSSSLVEDMDMTCSESYQRDFLNSIYMIGSMIGSSTFGVISDKYGRVRAMALSLLAMGVPGLVSVLWVNKFAYGVYRILAGMGYRGAIMIATVITSETAMANHKVLFIFIPHLGFNLGEMLCTFESYFIRQWKLLQLVQYGPIFVFSFLCLWVPNPARWLMSKDQVPKAKKILQKRAKMNGKDAIPEELFAPIPKVEKSNEESKPLSFGQSLKAILTNRILFIRSMNVIFQWFSVIMSYGGTLYIGTKLSGSPHTNFILTTIPAVFGNLPYLFLLDRFGRRNTLALCEFPIGISCLIVAFIGTNESLLVLQIVLSMMVRLFVSAAIKILFTMTAELFPTPIRSTTVGIGSAIGGLGGFFGLLIESLATIWNPLPLLIIGSLVTLAGLLTFFIPETKGKNLPETIDEAIKIGMK